MEWVEVRVVDRVVASHWLDLSCILSHEGCSLREVFWGYGKKCVIVLHWAGSHEVSSVVRNVFWLYLMLSRLPRTRDSSDIPP